MTGDRAEAVRRACTAWGEGDLAAIRAAYSEDVTADGGELWPEGSGAVSGVEDVLATFASIMRAFDESELIPEGFLEAGDTLVVPLTWRGRSAGSEGFVEQRLVGAYRFRGPLICEIRWFASLAAALDALGLPPDSAAGLVREPGA